MGLRLVKGAPTVKSRAGDKGALAFLLVSARGSVTGSLGWETLSGDPAPRGIGDGRDDDPVLRGIGEAVVEARRTRLPAARSVEVSLERPHVYAIIAAPLTGKGKDGEMAVVVHEAPAPRAGRGEGQVIRQLGHDLRTPLTSISGAVELLQSGRLGALQPQQERVLGMMQKGVDAMVRLIDEGTAPFRGDVAADLGLAALEDAAEDAADDAGDRRGGAGRRAEPADRPRGRRR